MGKVRVLVVDDSDFARKLLCGLLAADDDIDVVGEAGDGAQAVALVDELRPDVVTMDLEMPRMGGLEAIEEIMANHAVPILVVSDHTDAQRAYEAVARGALEVLTKPQLSRADGGRFAAKVKLLSGVRVITHLRRRHPVVPVSLPREAVGCDGAERLVAIAASTGGPQALGALLSRLPAEFPAPVVVAQHIADGFAAGMVEWLDTLSPLRVRLAEEGEPLRAGCVYVSPSEHHLTVTASRRAAFVETQPNDIYHPSCDTLLTSVAEACGAQAVGVIMTGMGRDGAAGLERIHAAGGHTLAQDEASSVVYGMNRVAVERGCVDRVLALEKLPEAVVRLTATHRAGDDA